MSTSIINTTIIIIIIIIIITITTAAATTTIIITTTTTTPRSRQLLEKIKITQLVKKFHILYGTRIFIIVFTRARQF
jgi:hypothetical protein